MTLTARVLLMWTCVFVMGAVASAQEVTEGLAETWAENASDEGGVDAPTGDGAGEGEHAGASGESGGTAENNGDVEADESEPRVLETAVSSSVASDNSSEMTRALELLVLPILLSENIDPVVGHHVSANAIEAFTAAGHTIVDVDRMERAIVQAGTPLRPSSAELWNVMFAADADRAVFFFVTARGGQYVVELRAASADGAGPFSGEVAASSSDLREAVVELCGRTLPPATSFDHEEAASIRARSQTVYDFEGTGGQNEPIARPSITSPFAPPPAPERGRLFELALTTQSAFGIGDEFFYNHLIGVRAGVRLTRMWAILFEFSYANLNGRDGREHSLLPLLSVQARFPLSRRLPLSLPVRFGVGYLFFNGPVVRASAGLNYALSDRFEIGLDIIAPIIWFRDNQDTLASMTIGLEAIVRL